MKATEAVDRVDPGRWRATPAAVRLDLLRRIRRGIDRHFDDLVSADCTAKGIDIEVGPRGRDRLLNGDRTDILRVTGEPRRTGPYQKPGGVVVVLGAGNFASSLEMINALFVDSCAVVHKPHPLNVGTDLVWEKVLQPLVDVHALAFCDVEEGHELTRDPRLTKIYFTGGVPSAKAVMAATDTELVSECGGNNPCVIIPGDRRWTASEIRHQALQIATMVKINGGSVCGRVQTLVTGRRRPQRREFLDAVTLALRDQTPATTAYYPGVDKTFATFPGRLPRRAAHRVARPRARIAGPDDRGRGPGRVRRPQRGVLPGRVRGRARRGARRRVVT